ncbi:hypothetical protein CSV72_05510 [Sporosarcina sp. P20a]|uniref:AAA family ATPase n=1 Tax=Sporosarcina sp. P20a TaxID=2048256 RepID=UPI000C165AE5|nr:SMC family ATPase [Sporosarcina sp. P20a]PIC87425.1 hypothetical protein CSV72_05510 [Sporosarcina sp. P20a]
MRLKKLVVNNFRNYIGEVSFNLSKDIIILYGDNGNGKSSFFDAIEWCITGEISRFSLAKNEYKSVVANSSISIGKECSVAIYFDDYVLKKSFLKNSPDSYSQTFTTLYTSELSKLTSGEDKVNQKMGEIISKNVNGKWDNKILSQAYILSQTQITNFITKDTPKDRYNSLASIMGFEKINNLKNNLSGTAEILLNKVNTIREEVDKIRETKKKEQVIFDLNIKKIGIRNEELKDKIDINLYSQKLSVIKDAVSELNRSLNSLSKFNTFNQQNELQFTDLINKTEIKIEQLEEIIQKDINSKNQAALKIKQLHEEKTATIKEKEILSQNNENQENMSKSLIRLKNNGYNYNEVLTQELKKQKNQLDIKLPIFQYAYDNLERYLVSKEKLDIKIIETKKLKVESKDLEKNIEQVKIDISELLADFSQGIVSNNIEKLLLLVEDTRLFISDKSDSEDICPVCDSYVEDIDSVLNKKIKSIIFESGKHKELIENNIEKRKEFENQQRKLLDSRIEINNLIKINEQIILELNSVINSIQNNILFDASLFLYDIKKVQRKKIVIEAEHKSLIDDLAISQKIDAISKDLSQFENEALKFGSITIEEFNDLINNEEKNLRTIEQRILSNKYEIDRSRKLLNEMSSSLSVLTELFSIYKKNSIPSLKEFLSVELRRFRKEEQKIENIISESTNINELSRIKKYINSIEEEENSLLENKKYFLEKSRILNNKIVEINLQFGDKASDFLNSIASPIRRYYHYLNPNPSEFNDLYFEITGNNELDIQVKNDNNNIVANYILSSGQMNVLAIAIFIATNIAQTFSYFDFIAIDDPIQNMDDLNRFSITDVLSQLDQQLIFSTHDSDYVNLFIKKNENRIDNIAVFHLDAENNSYRNIVDYSNAKKK